MNDPSQKKIISFILNWVAAKNLSLHKYVIEIGANEPEFYSNSFLLINKGWKAVLVEPHPDTFLSLKDVYENVDEVTLINKAIWEQNGSTKFTKFKHNTTNGRSHSMLSQIGHHPNGQHTSVETITVKKLKETVELNDIGILSIDVEGTELEIFKQLVELKVRMPQILVIEHGRGHVKLRDQDVYIQGQGYKPLNSKGDFKLEKFGDNHLYVNSKFLKG